MHYSMLCWRVLLIDWCCTSSNSIYESKIAFRSSSSLFSYTFNSDSLTEDSNSFEHMYSSSILLISCCYFCNVDSRQSWQRYSPRSISMTMTWRKSLISPWKEEHLLHFWLSSEFCILTDLIFISLWKIRNECKV